MSHTIFFNHLMYLNQIISSSSLFLLYFFFLKVTEQVVSGRLNKLKKIKIAYSIRYSQRLEISSSEGNGT